jgi:hypothetical protein
MQHGAAAEDVVTPSPASAISASRGEYQAHPCTDRYRLCGDAHDLRPVELSMGANVVTALSDAHFVKLYTDVLMRLCNANGMNAYLPDKHDKVSIFYSTFRQPFSLESYVTRIVNFTNCSRSVFVNALVYLDRIKQTDPRLAISEMNVHRVLMTAVVLSVKFLEDELYQNSYFAKVGGIQTVAEFVRIGTRSGLTGCCSPSRGAVV